MPLSGVTLQVERPVYAPSEPVVVIPLGIEGVNTSAWAGIIPASVPHGDEAENNKHDIQYRYLNALKDGKWSFSPVKEGDWTVRLNHGGKELASASFSVSRTHVPPGQNAPELIIDRITFAPSERPLIRFRAPTAYSNSAWVGIIPADKPHGDEAENNKYDIQYKYLNGQAEGTLDFSPVPAGQWSARINVWGIETASVEFEVVKEHVPPGQNDPELILDRAVFAPSEKIAIAFKAPTAYPRGAWAGIIPADKPHGDEVENNKHDVQYKYLESKGEGTLVFNPLPPGKWSARINVWGIETASVDFEVEQNIVPPGQNPPSLRMSTAAVSKGEQVKIAFTAPTAYPASAWVGIIPADKPHGSEDENNRYDVQYKYLNSQPQGELVFNPLPPGKWSARINVWGVETASIDFDVAEGPAPRSNPVESAPTGVVAVDKPVSSRVEEPQPEPVVEVAAEKPSQKKPKSGNSLGGLFGELTKAVEDLDAIMNGETVATEKAPEPVPEPVVEEKTGGSGLDELSEAVSEVENLIKETEDLFGGLFGKKKSKPKQETVSRPVEPAVTAPVAETVSRPVQETAGKPVERVTSQPAETVSKPAERVSGKPVETVSGNQPATIGSSQTGVSTASKTAPAVAGEVAPPDWMKDLPDIPQVAPIQLSENLDLSEITRDAYAGMVSHAKEGLAELLGPMTPDQRERYDASWQPMYRYPAEECLEYLEQIVPVIEDVLRLRPALAEYSVDLQRMWVSAGYAELYDQAAAREIMLQALPTLATIKSMQVALDQSMSRLADLGDPPDPGVLQQAAAERHRRAMRTLESLLLGNQALEGYFELQQKVEFSDNEPGVPFYSVTHRTKGLFTRAITPFGGSKSDLVLFSDYQEADIEEDESSFLGSLDFDFDSGPWSTWYAEPTSDGWVTYDYDEEDEGWLNVCYYRVEVDRLVVDDYTVSDGKVSGEREIFHKAPLEAAPHIYGEEVDPRNPQATVDLHRKDLAEAEAYFRESKAAFQKFIQRGGQLPPLPDPENVYWVLKDIQTTIGRNEKTRERAYADKGLPSTYFHAETFDYGPDHLSTVWKKVNLEWDIEYPEMEVPAGSVYIADPSKEEFGPEPIVTPIEKSVAKSATIFWTPPPAVMPDGANWLIDPRLEGDDALFGIEKAVRIDSLNDGFGLIDMPKLSSGLFSTGPRGIQLSRTPLHADELPTKEEEELAARTLSSEQPANNLVVSLKSNRLGQREYHVPVTVATPIGYLDLRYVYEERVMTPEEAFETARKLEGNMAFASYSDVKSSTDETKSQLQGTIFAEETNAELDRERRALHKANIAWAKMEAERLRQDIVRMSSLMESGKATQEDIERFNQLQFRHVVQQSTVISEQDRIMELETGELVHSRTPFDDYCHVQMINKCRESVRELGDGLRARKKMEYLMDKLGPDQKRNAISIMSKMSEEGKGLYREDYERLNQAMQNIFQGEQQYQQAKIDEEVAWENAWVEGAEWVKTGADVGMALTSMAGGPMLVNVLYQAGNGYIDKGPVEGLKRAITTYSDAADIAVSGYEGWKTGGFWGAVEGASFSLIMNKGPEAALGRMNLNARMGGGFDGGFGKINVGKAPDVSTRVNVDGKAPDVSTRAPDAKAADVDPAIASRRGREAIEGAKMQQEMEWGKQLADDAFSDYAKLRTAEIRGDMNPEELAALRMQVRQKMAAVGNSMTAKSYLKYDAPPRMGKAYTEVYNDILDDAVSAYKMGMREAGFNDQKIAQYRNASSIDTGMDADMGVIEAPEIQRVVGSDGKVTYKKVVVITKNGKRVPMRVYQEEGSKIMAQAFRKVSGGYSAHGSFVDVTTRVHPESYKDLAWLGLPKAGPHSDLPNVTKKIDQVFGKIDPDLTPQSLGVTLTKAEIMFKEHPELTPLGSMMENCRGTAKDLDTKFIPMVDSKIRKLEATPPAEITPTIRKQLAELNDTRKYLSEVSGCFNDIGKGRTHPGRWMEDFRQVTGGTDPLAVTKRLVAMTNIASKM